MTDPLTATLLTQAKPIVANIITGVISNAIYDFTKKGIRRRANATRTEKAIRSYLESLYSNVSKINTIAFKNIPKQIDDIYIPLIVSSPINSEESYEVDLHFDITTISNKLLLVDSAGMGKSTITKWMIRNVIRIGQKIPLFIELRNYSPSGDIMELFANTIGVSVDVIKNILSTLPVVIFLDGLDEAPIPSLNSLLDDIKKISKNYPSTIIFISSREQPEVMAFSDFKQLKIEDLTREQASELIKKYDNDGGVSRALNVMLKKQQSDLWEFLDNPLYVSLLYCAYKHRPKSSIPNKKHEFYSLVYDSLYEAHDLTKKAAWSHDKHSKLDSTEFNKVLRYLGYICLTNDSKLEFTKDELLATLDKIENQIPELAFSPALFVKDGNQIRWSHKSLQEYFTSMFICFDTGAAQENILLELYNDRESWRFYAILLMCSDIKYEVFRNVLGLKILQDYVNYQIDTSSLNSRISDSDITVRKSSTFGRNFHLIFLDNLNPEDIFSIDREYLDKYIEAAKITDTDLIQVTLTLGSNRPFTLLIEEKSINAGIFEILLQKEKHLASLSDLVVSDKKNKIDKSTLTQIKGLFSINDFSKGLVSNSSNFKKLNALISKKGTHILNDDRALELINEIKTRKTSCLAQNLSSIKI